MMDAAVDQLTPRERECLTLVLEPLDNKEIAVVLGIAPNTVANHIKSAKQKLGASTKRQAARLMRDAYDLKSASPPSAITFPPPTGPSVAASDRVSAGATFLREEQMPFDVGTAFDLQSTRTAAEEAHHGLSIGRRLLIMVALAVAMSVAFGGLLAGVDALSRLVRS